MATVGRIIVGVLVINAVLLLYSAHAARLKDIADIEGVRGNQLYGYGIVIGLNGTGDGNSVDFTTKSISNMIEKMGIRVDPADINVKNVAGVVVTAELPPFVRPGTKLDVTVSSLGDAKSLEGGLLLLTQLKGADGNTYAVAQGSMSVGGFNVGAGGDATIKNHPTIGAIPNGAIVERTIPFDLFQSGRVRIVLRQPDFTTMTRVVSAINTNFGRKIAQAVDAASVEIGLTGPSAKDPITMVARLENIEVEQDIGARVVVNERTGTIVIGSSVRISTVALAHGNISIAIRSETQVSQPSPLSEQGETEVVTNTDIAVAEEEGRVIVVGGVTLGELVDGLNSLGVTPRDMIAIFNALKRAGALHAELVTM